MSRTQIKVIKDDKLYYLNFTLLDHAGAVVDLTGSTIKLKVQRPGETELMLNEDMQIVEADEGTCRYQVQDGDFDETGTLNAEIEVTYTDTTEIITFPDIVIRVQSDLPNT